MKLSTLSLAPSLLGVVIVMSADPSVTDFVRAAVCFALAIAMCWAGEAKRGVDAERRSARRERTAD